MSSPKKNHIFVIINAAAVFVACAVVGAVAMQMYQSKHKAAAVSPTGSPTATTGGQPQQQFTPGPQPPGPVPAGKVWSAEHGHWHDIPGAAGAGQPQQGQTLVPQQQQFTPGPQPPGPVPAGKEWNAEHGHWHDIMPPATPVPVPAPSAPKP